jgi:type I restriction enzyme S subunit
VPSRKYEVYSVPAFPTGQPEILDGSEIGSNKRCVQPGDVLICKINPRINRVWLVKEPLNGLEQIASTEWLVLRVPEANREPLVEYLTWYLRGPAFRDWIKLNVEDATGSHTRAKSPNILRQGVPIPAVGEQSRIVAAIEQQFSRLEVGVAALERARRRLAQMRSALLDAAILGHLQVQIAGLLEPASSSIERVNCERRVRHQGGRGAHPPDLQSLPFLPEGWTWTTLDNIVADEPNALKAGPFGSALKKSMYAKSGFKIYGQEQVIRGDPYYGSYLVDKEKYLELSSCAVKPDDLLVSLVGTVGKTLVLPADIEPGIINPRLVKISLHPELMTPAFLSLVLQAPFMRARFHLESHGATMEVLNLGILRSLPIPCPPLEIGQAILGQVDSSLTLLDRLDEECDKASRRVLRLRTVILRNAFSGELVPRLVTDIRDPESPTGPQKVVLRPSPYGGESSD